MAATINPGSGPAPTTASVPWLRPRRPAVLDASRAALIPLRPLTITEVLDAAFLVVRRNARLMIGLPLVIAGGAGAYLLGGIGIWFLLSESSADWAQILAVVLYGLLGLLLLTMSLVWMTAVLSGVTLQTVLGPGFAPPTVQSLRRSLRLFWPMIGLSVLQWVAGSVLQSVISILYYLALLGTLINSDQLGPAITIIVSVIGYLLLAAAYSYISLTVPAYATENQHAPAWIGTPQRRTNIVTAFGRSITLIGLRNLPRATLIMAGGMAISVTVVLLVGIGSLMVVLLYATALGADPLVVLTSGWTYIGVFGFASIVAMSALLAFIAAVQTLLYLDLRMRREGLDLAMRFDCVPIPQPTAPPPVYLVPIRPPMPPPPMPPRPMAPQQPPGPRS
jgi:hypothetical protein